MADAPKRPDDAEEWYASTYTHFFRVIKLLAEEPEVQCALGQYDNVAWEIEDDTVNLSELVLSLPGGSLLERQRTGIAQLVTEVAALSNESVT